MGLLGFRAVNVVLGYDLYTLRHHGPSLACIANRVSVSGISVRHGVISLVVGLETETLDRITPAACADR